MIVNDINIGLAFCAGLVIYAIIGVLVEYLTLKQQDKRKGKQWK